jgi:hypothetical protein
LLLLLLLLTLLLLTLLLLTLLLLLLLLLLPRRPPPLRRRILRLVLSWPRGQLRGSPCGRRHGRPFGPQRASGRARRDRAR